MHNCKATQETILDLVFNEADADQQASLKVEMNECVTCRAEYASLTQTLDTVEYSMESAQPTEDFWPAYNARLAQRLKQSAQSTPLSVAASVAPATNGFLQKLWRAFLIPVRVPVSIAAIFLVVLGALTVAVVRSDNPVVPIPTVQRVVETRNVEVPVIQERVVTRVVYVNRNQTREPIRFVRAPVIKKDERGTPAAAAPQSESSLAGFRPIDQVKLTVIKGSESNEW